MANYAKPIAVMKVDHYKCGNCDQRIPSPVIRRVRGEEVKELTVFCPFCKTELIWAGVQM